jgi:hypothetical protein
MSPISTRLKTPSVLFVFESLPFILTSSEHKEVSAMYQM